MIPRRHGHRKNINAAIISGLKTRPDEWLTSSQVAKIIRIGYPRTIGWKLNYLCDEDPQIEHYLERTSHVHYYRYTTEMKHNKTGSEMK